MKRWQKTNKEKDCSVYLQESLFFLSHQILILQTWIFTLFSPQFSCLFMVKSHLDQNTPTKTLLENQNSMLLLSWKQWGLITGDCSRGFITSRCVSYRKAGTDIKIQWYDDKTSRFYRSSSYSATRPNWRREILWHWRKSTTWRLKVVVRHIIITFLHL